MRAEYYTENFNLIIKIPLPGVDPKDIKLSYLDNKLIINDCALTYNISDRYDLGSAKAEIKYGLLTVQVPEFPNNRGVIKVRVPGEDPENKILSPQ